MTFEEFLLDAKNWECPHCKERMNASVGTARWNGKAWEHRCIDIDPQAGCIEAIRVDTLGGEVLNALP